MNKSISEQLAEAIGFLRDIQKEHQYYCNKLAEAEKKNSTFCTFWSWTKLATGSGAKLQPNCGAVCWSGASAKTAWKNEPLSPNF